MPFRRAPTLSTSYASNACTTASSAQDSTRKVLVDEEELVFRVHNANSAVALKRALTDPTDSWDFTKKTPSIRLGSRYGPIESFESSSRVNGNGYEVLTVGSIVCSPQELVSVLCSTDESDYNAAMKGLYGNQFIYGSVVQVLDGNQAKGVMPVEQEVVAGKAVGGRVDQLDGVTALLVVDTVPSVSKNQSDGNSTKLRVMFHALYKENEEPVPGQASDKMARSRLVALAGGIPRLPMVVRRRRLGMQVFANHSINVPIPKAEVHNMRCISCTKGIRLKTNHGHIATMGVCTRCLEWVDRCDYSHVQICHRGPVEIVEDQPLSGPSSLGQSLREDLAVESTRNAAVSVIKMLLDTWTESTSSSDAESFDNNGEEKYMSAVEQYFDRRAREAPAAKDCILSNAQQRNYPLHPMETSSPSAPIPENEIARLECIDKYGLMDLKEPMPELDIICSFLSKELGFFCTMITIVEPMPELDIICSFLSKELGFFCTMITIVGETHQLVLSCTIGDFVHAMLPREHTFCQHLLMGDAPFIIRNPEADVRFYNLNPVTRQGVKYYCGIPITGPDGAMVGSICCVHSSAMDITRSQYDTLVRFGEIASKIIRVKAEAKLQSS
ncbi:hypothetical protein PHMEG_0004008 [Phytophthora megakarya]|uniref:GAF domain-containing protein n=1 Tax=Phytophthora megakarya TaxID=4795 RepID=A0A225WX93_9STRA|nr:hypothetical protein PHMEG_0004008 [Phytophthora megakarya]